MGLSKIFLARHYPFSGTVDNWEKGKLAEFYTNIEKLTRSGEFPGISVKVTYFFLRSLPSKRKESERVAHVFFQYASDLPLEQTVIANLAARVLGVKKEEATA